METVAADAGGAIGISNVTVVYGAGGDVATPKPVFNAQARLERDFLADWQEVPDVEPFKNSYRCGWDLFLRHVAEGTPFPSPLLAGAKGLQLVDACYRSHRERRWIELPPLSL